MSATARKAMLAVASTALVLGAVAGCGGDGSSSSAPDDASKDDFCEAFSGLFEGILADVGAGDVSESDSVAAIKDWAADMREVGTPSEMPDQAREGFEVFVEAAEDLDENASLGDLESLGGDLSAADQEAGDAFGTWAIENCPSALPGLDDLPSDLPTELPSELGSELPSELESLMSELPTDPSELESMMSELTADAG